MAPGAFLDKDVPWCAPAAVAQFPLSRPAGAANWVGRLAPKGFLSEDAFARQACEALFRLYAS